MYEKYVNIFSGKIEEKAEKKLIKIHFLNTICKSNVQRD